MGIRDRAAKEAAVVLARLSSNEKNNALKASADALEKNINEVLEAKDVYKRQPGSRTNDIRIQNKSKKGFAYI